MIRKFLVFLLVIVFGTGQAMVFVESGAQEAEQAEDRKPEANIGNTEDTESTTEESEENLGETVRKISQTVIRKHQIESPSKGAFHIDIFVHCYEKGHIYAEK